MIYYRVEKEINFISVIIQIQNVRCERCVVDHDFGTKPVLGGGPTDLLDMGTVGSTPITDAPALLSLSDNAVAKFKDDEGDILSIDNVC